MIRIERNQIELDGLLLSPFLENLAEFNCGEADLDDFFINDARRHEDQLLARTYALYVTSGKKFGPAALISFCNDSIRAESFANGDFKKIRKKLPHGKRYNNLPAVKIARLGVKKEYQRSGIGSHLLNMTKLLFLTDNRTGCRFITVDAYNTTRAITFYINAGFVFMKMDHKKLYDNRLAESQQAEDAPTLALYYDLKKTAI